MSKSARALRSGCVITRPAHVSTTVLLAGLARSVMTRVKEGATDRTVASNATAPEVTATRRRESASVKQVTRIGNYYLLKLLRGCYSVTEL